MDANRTRIVISLLRIGANLQREGDRVLEPFGLNQQQFVALTAISQQGPISHTDICAALLFEKSNISRIVKKLKGVGYISGAPSGEDKRMELLSITDAGSAVAHNCLETLNNWNYQWLSEMDDEEVADALTSLDRIATLFREG